MCELIIYNLHGWHEGGEDMCIYLVNDNFKVVLLAKVYHFNTL